MDLQNIKTKSGKTIKDFVIPKELLADEELIGLIMGSESMNDDERQYWFNLTTVMDEDQTKKLREILVSERQKLAEIAERYGDTNKEKTVKLTTDQITEIQQKRETQKKSLSKQEELMKKEEETEESILAELANL